LTTKKKKRKKGKIENILKAVATLNGSPRLKRTAAGTVLEEAKKKGTCKRRVTPPTGGSSRNETHSPEKREGLWKCRRGRRTNCKRRPRRAWGNDGRKINFDNIESNGRRDV